MTCWRREKKGEERARGCPLFASRLRIFFFLLFIVIFLKTTLREELRSHEAEGFLWFVVVLAVAGDLLLRQTMRIVGNNWRRFSRCHEALASVRVLFFPLLRSNGIDKRAPPAFASFSAPCIGVRVLLLFVGCCCVCTVSWNCGVPALPTHTRCSTQPLTAVSRLPLLPLHLVFILPLLPLPTLSLISAPLAPGNTIQRDLFHPNCIKYQKLRRAGVFSLPCGDVLIRGAGRRSSRCRWMDGCR